MLTLIKCCNQSYIILVEYLRKKHQSMLHLRIVTFTRSAKIITKRSNLRIKS